MSNFSFLQIVIIVLLFVLIFGDVPKITNTLKKIIKNLKKNNRKKGN